MNTNLGPNAPMPEPNEIEDLRHMAAYDDAIENIASESAPIIQSEEGFYEHDLMLDYEPSTASFYGTEIELRPSSHRTEIMLPADLCGHGAEADSLEYIDWEA